MKKVPVSYLQATMWLGSMLVLSGALSGCSDSPKQYADQKPIAVGRPATPDAGGLAQIEKPTSPEPGNEPVPTIDQDALTRQNAREPIVYGVGAGGITWDTDIKESQAKLSKPEYGPDAGGVAQYKSGMQITWRVTEPRQPTSILMWTDYLGTFDVGGKFGQWKLGDDLSRLFQNDEKGERFIVDLYNHLERKPADYDCLKTGICQIIGWDKPTVDEITLWMPKLALLIAKDRKTLFLIRLDNALPKGLLHHDLDLVTGEILVPKERGQKIGLGQTWGDILAINGENVKTDVGYNSMGKSYEGVYLELTKSSFLRGYKSEPLATEKLRSIAIYGTYTQPLRLNGRLIEMRKGSEKGRGGVELALVDGDPVDGVRYVRLIEDVAAEDQIGVLNGFVDLLRTELSKSGGQTLTRRSGHHKPVGKKTYAADVVSFDVKSGVGRLVSFGFSEETKRFNYVAVADIISAVDKVIIPSLFKPYVAVDNSAGEKGRNDAGEAVPIEFAGFRLGDTLELKDVDLGRSEATVVLPGDAGEARASYADATAFEVSYDGERREYQTQVAVSFGSLGVRLGLTSVKNETGRFEITSISSSAPAVSRLCGIEGLNLEPGEDAKALLRRVQAAIAVEKKKSASFECPYFQINDRLDTGRLAYLFFPKQKLKLSFAEQELTLISVFTRPTEVQQ